ncbi:hypothetical protein H1P_3330002 [Hyella patelloides LEGE 07179]|uniref:Uncharacterized protein n=1 Tax=Hyella patelloides LEGE 07179 TaxID=945734 RepID=A0A563VVJ5_9CYAN|nr:hypothetical protein [Hyella patelloides]VEP15417.1 hypothetical protein H1P_3330002 [Hyella patelloides LEGE 07179]
MKIKNQEQRAKKLPLIPLRVEIKTLYANEDMEISCYYAEGHWESRSVAIAMNQELDTVEGDLRPIFVSDVKHSYLTKINDVDQENDEFIWYKETAQKISSDSFPVSVVQIN